MLASPTPSAFSGRRLQVWLARAASRRLGPDGKINAWTLTFVDPHVEVGFLRNHREQLRSSIRRVVIVVSCALVYVLYLYMFGEDVGQYPTQDAISLRRWQLAFQVTNYVIVLSILVTVSVLSDYSLIGPHAVEALAIVAMVVATLQSSMNIRHYLARAFGYDDPSAVWGVNLTGSDAPFLLYLTLCVAGSGTLVRWKALVPLALISVLGYVAAVYVLGGPDMRLAPTNLLFFAFIVLVICSGKRSSEFQARLLHLSYLREKEMRFQAEFSLECVADRDDVHVEIGSDVGGSCSLPQSVPVAPPTSDDVQADCVGKPLAARSNASTPSAPSAPLSAQALFGPAAADCLAEAGGGAALQCLDWLPLDASVWVEGRASSCPLRDLERGQRVLCYDLLGRSIRYVEVVEKHTNVREVPWISVSLDDGTQDDVAAEQRVQLADQRDMARAPGPCPGRDGVVVQRPSTLPAPALPAAGEAVSQQPGAQGACGRA